MLIQVRNPCRKCLLEVQSRVMVAHKSDKPIAVSLRSIVHRLSGNLAELLKTSEAEGLLAAQQLMSALVVSGKPCCVTGINNQPTISASEFVSWCFTNHCRSTISL